MVLIALPIADAVASTRGSSRVRIVIPVDEGLTALDAVGPYEVLTKVPGATVQFVASSAGLKRTDHGLGLQAGSTWR